MKHWRQFIGISRVARNERGVARIVGRFFEWVLFTMAVFLPLLWYMDLNNRLSFTEMRICHWIIWSVFALELLVVTSLVKRKRVYLRGNWLNILIVIVGFPVFWPNISLVAANRVLRVLLIVRVVVPFAAKTKEILSRNHLGTTLIVFFLVIISAGFTVANFNSGIKSPMQGIWWAMETATTVGYGDVVPTTLAGKIFAMFMMLFGVAMGSILTANFSAYLLGNRNTNTKLIADMSERMGELEEQLNRIEDLLQKEVSTKSLLPQSGKRGRQADEGEQELKSDP